MKSFIKPAVLFVALAAVFTFASCEADMKTESPAMYTVTYDGNGAVPAFNEKLSVKSGDYLPIPELIPEKTGYDFSGWYIDDAKADSETKITKNTTVTAHWTAHEYTIIYAGLEDAENPNTVTAYTIESEDITLLDATKTGCTFGGWKNGDEFVTEIAKGSTGDITLTAVWEIIPVTGVILNKTEFTLITGDTETLTATVLPENAFDKTVTWTSSDTGVATVTDGVVTAVAKGNATITATAGGHSVDCMVTVKNYIELPAGTDGTAGTDGVYLLFGRWPQTIKAADVTITDETKTAGMFTYYKGSDGEWYVKAAENVYHNENETYDYTYSDGTIVAQGGTSEKYFKVEPIKWRVLTDNYSGKKLLLAENVLVNCSYYDYININRTIGGKTVYPNNYEHSRIRAYLNGLNYEQKEASDAEQVENTVFYGTGFLQTAFSVGEKEQIETVTVDNSARSTNPDANAVQWNRGLNQYACKNTEDKIFLLSEKEVTTASYGFDVYGRIDVRIRVITDFAKASGAFQSTMAKDGCFWWLRSPFYDDRRFSCYVDYNGVTGHDLVFYSDIGVVPALCLE